MKNIFVFDVESISLHGEGFAVGAIVAERNGNIIDTFELLSKQEIEYANDWVKENVIPHLSEMPTCETQRELRTQFYEFYMKHKESCDIWSDCNFPVETNFLSAIVADDKKNREWNMPFPLLDIATIVDNNIDREKESGIVGLRKHHPTDDCKASLNLLLKKLNEPQINKMETTKPKLDSTSETLLHIKRVNQLMTEAASELIRRANVHDDSKLKSPEKEMFDEVTEKLAGSTYGSDEYKETLKLLKPALDHHYANNTHHPEHYLNGVNGMDLFDIIEMFFDWKAAGERHNNGNIYKSIDINKGRFKMSDQLVDIFTNTAERFGYEKPLQVNEVIAKEEIINNDFGIDNIKLGLSELKEKIK